MESIALSPRYRYLIAFTGWSYHPIQHIDLFKLWTFKIAVPHVIELRPVLHYANNGCKPTQYI